VFHACVRPRWEKDFQHVTFQGQGQDTGTRSASVSIRLLTSLSTPEFVSLNRYVISNRTSIFSPEAGPPSTANAGGFLSGVPSHQDRHAMMTQAQYQPSDTPPVRGYDTQTCQFPFTRGKATRSLIVIRHFQINRLKPR
jgi:hypothetical protein